MTPPFFYCDASFEKKYCHYVTYPCPNTSKKKIIQKMNTSTNRKTTVSFLIIFSLSAFLYLNLGHSGQPECLSGKENNISEQTPLKENAGLLPEVDILKDTYSKFNEIKPLFERKSTP